MDMIPTHLKEIYIKVLKRRYGIKAQREGNTVFVWIMGYNMVRRNGKILGDMPEHLKQQLDQQDPIILEP